LNAVLLFLIGCRLLSDSGAALIAALLFAVHPVNAEAVNFISTRNTLLALFFCLASLLAYLKDKEKGKRWPILSALLFFCALLSKETGLMLIAVIAFCTQFPLTGKSGGKWRDRLLSLLPYVLATGVYLVMRTYSLQGVVGTGIPKEGLFSRLAMNYHIVPQYLGLLLFPADLTLFHSVPKGGLFTPPWHFPVWLALVAAVWLIVRWRNRVALFGLAWFVINYLPISNIVPIPSDPITERFLYMPAIGLFLVVGALLERLLAIEKAKKAVWVTSVLIVIVFSALTVRRNLEWKDDYTLFSSGVRTNPASAEAHYHLGTALRDRGELEAANREWETSLKLDPYNSDALIQLGTYSAMRGDLHGAEQYYHAALQSPPGKVDPGKAMAHYNLGKIYEKQRKPAQALLQYELFLKNVTLDYNEFKPDAERRVLELNAALRSDTR
jgi:tetratricopeptide (TPR) repeat protein